MKRAVTRRLGGVASILLVLSCGGSRGSVTEEAGAGAEREVLVATRPSEFKTEIVAKLVSAYEDRARLTLIDMADLNDVRDADYDALVVMGARMGFLMFSARERRFLRHLRAPEKLVMVMTAANQEWKWKREDIDVITCASESRNIEPVYRQVSERLDAILER